MYTKKPKAMQRLMMVYNTAGSSWIRDRNSWRCTYLQLKFLQWCDIYRLTVIAQPITRTTHRRQSCDRLDYRTAKTHPKYTRLTSSPLNFLPLEIRLASAKPPPAPRLTSSESISSYVMWKWSKSEATELGGGDLIIRDGLHRKKIASALVQYHRVWRPSLPCTQNCHKKEACQCP